MLSERTLPALKPPSYESVHTPKPFFDEDARPNPMLSVEAFRAATPLFLRETRQIPGLHEDRRTRRRLFWRGLLKELRYFLILWAFMLFIEGGARILSGQASVNNLVTYAGAGFVVTSVTILALSFFSSLFLEFSLLSLRIKPGEEWDLLRLTSLSRRGIAVTFFAFNRLYHRRSMITIFNQRLFSLYGLVLVSAAVWYLVDRYVAHIFDFVQYEYLHNHPAQGVVLLLTVGAVALILLLEVRWRVSGMAAFGTALALSLIGSELAVLARVAALIGSWMAEIGLFAVSWLISGRTVLWLRGFQPDLRWFAERGGLGIEPVQLQLLFAVILSGIGLYLYFRLMRFVSLRIAFRAMQRVD